MVTSLLRSSFDFALLPSVRAAFQPVRAARQS